METRKEHKVKPALTDADLIAALEQRMREKQQALGESESLLKQLKQLNTQLEASEKLKSEFLSNIRNEINNPFGAILCLSENILGLQPTQFNQALAMAALIHKEAFKLHFQLQNIFAAAEIEAGELQLIAAQVDIEALVQNVVATFAQAIRDKSLRVNISAAQGTAQPEKRVFRTDAGKAALILSNLVANAVEYSPAGGVVEISWLVQKEGIEVSMKDQGPGIQKSHQHVIFNRFTQIDATSTRQHGGHGLGLSVVKALLDAMDGSIIVKSTPQRGSLFTIRLPQLPGLHPGEDFSDGNTLFFQGSEWQDEQL